MTAETPRERRSLKFNDLHEAARDAQMLLDRGYDRVGNWTLSQCCSHLSDWLRFPVEGFPRQPAAVRFIFWVMRHAVGKRMLSGWLSSGSMPAGKPTIPETVARSPGDDAEAVARFRQAIERFKAHAGAYHPSPLFGELDRETATKLQLIHCAHHLSFLLPRQS